MVLAVLAAVAGLYGLYVGIFMPGWETDQISAELGRAYERSKARERHGTSLAPLSPGADVWRDAVNTAMAASEAVQTAETVAEWRQAADLWREAIELMKAVPASSEYYPLAQEKALEYQPNFIYTQQRAQ
ncbi:MAG: hypothetical protein HC812_06145 [Leptolyngbya sp. RL_3_1]|nr:hypothetical protein [Leptolyngbya sp. RL_3_1]